MIKPIAYNDLEIVRNLAYKIWPLVYKDMISQDQITYMLNWMYAKETLQNAHISGDFFYAYYREEEAVGFIHLQPNHEVLKLQKIYILPEFQKEGIGREFINFCNNFCQQNNFKELELQVNRENSAVSFYLKNGFSIFKEEDFDIGNGFLMNDFIMKKRIYF
ncbi:MAG: GNAT family N-acetyltransferase [Bacteroidetes bacterium]|nr:GNAT family N-acetyltransferase [Bacteroidota bacterium]